MTTHWPKGMPKVQVDPKMRDTHRASRNDAQCAESLDLMNIALTVFKTVCTEHERRLRFFEIMKIYFRWDVIHPVCIFEAIFHEKYGLPSLKYDTRMYYWDDGGKELAPLISKQFGASGIAMTDERAHNIADTARDLRTFA